MVLGAGKTLYTLHVTGAGFVDVTAHRYGANEGHSLDGRIGQQHVYLFFTAVDNLQHTLGGACFFKQLRQTHRGQRVLLGRLENEGVTGGNGHREHPQRDHGREVERRDTGTDTQRLGVGIGVDLAGHVLNGFTHHQ